jgi:hypothetical protein
MARKRTLVYAISATANEASRTWTSVIDPYGQLRARAKGPPLDQQCTGARARADVHATDAAK